MKVSKMAIKTSKTMANDDNLVQAFLEQGGQAKKFSAGLYAFGPFLTKAKRKLEDVIRRNLEENGCVEVTFPILQARNFWDASGRWDKYIESGIMFHTTGRHGEYAVSPTAEEMSMEYMRNAIVSYKDLNQTIYQIGLKFRDEIRVQGGLLRTKEFTMMDAYSFDESKEAMEATYGRIAEAYANIFKDLELNVIPVKAVNTFGGKVSHEYMCVDNIYGQDTILYSKELNLIFNKELLDDEVYKAEILAEYPNLDIDSLKTSKAMELGHIFLNNQFYSKMMNGTYTNKEGKTDYYWNGCYGIGVSRVLFMLIAKSFEKYGKLIWSKAVRPYDCTIINLDTEELNAAASTLYNNLKNVGINALWDDRSATMGVKLKDNELFGNRYVIILGKNYFNTSKYELEDRATGSKTELSESELIEFLKHN